MPSMRGVLRAVLPQPVIDRLIQWRSQRFERLMAAKNSEEIFDQIYKQGIWGEDRGGARFYSGNGSHDAALVDPYVEAVGAFLDSFPEKLDVVDLGCGDFAVGARIRPKCGRYVACDISAALIDHHRTGGLYRDVDFQKVNIATDELPAGEVAFLRQVLQHISNAEIGAALPKLKARYRYLIVTEHIPSFDFEPNKDMATGIEVRTKYDSGVVLTAPPFSLEPIEERVLCDLWERNDLQRTILYRLK